VRVAFVGKGGSGKSVLAATFARLLARRGEPVLTVDSDPLPGLALSLGVDVTDAGIPDEAVEDNPDESGPPYRLREGLSASEAVRRYAPVGPDGVRVLQFGKVRGHVGALRRSQFAFRQILAELPRDEWSLVGDLPAGTRQAFFGWGHYAETVLVVTEPTTKSVLTARRLARLAETEEAPRIAVVVNKLAEPGQAQEVAQRTGLAVVGAVPADEHLLEAEHLGGAVLDHAPECAAAAAVASLLERLREEEAGP
jgi:CO dehydrogenase maturation factor